MSENNWNISDGGKNVITDFYIRRKYDLDFKF